MIPFLNRLVGGQQETRLLVASFDATIVRATNAAQSITCASSTDATEIFIIPANSILRPGDYVTLEMRGIALNNDGAGRRLNLRMDLDAVNIVTPSAGQINATNANQKPWFFYARIMLTAATTANLILHQGHGSGVSVGSLPAGTQYGEVAGFNPAGMLVRGIAFDPSVAHVLKASALWDVTSANVALNPFERLLTASRF